MKYETERRGMIEAALTMLKYRLISLAGGNIALRMPCGNFLITPSAMAYETMLPEDIVLVDRDGKTVEGTRRPSSDMLALLYIFNHKPEVNAVIHTHQPYATAVGLVEDELPGCLVTILDACRTAVPVAPFTISSDEGMGKLTVDYCKDALAVILRNHGVIAFGKDLNEALHSAVYLEESAKTYLAARALGSVHLLTPEEIAAESAPRGNYRQP